MSEVYLQKRLHKTVNEKSSNMCEINKKLYFKQKQQLFIV